MARSFSAALDNAFMLDSDVDNLSQSVQQKQQYVTIQSRELQALEARIREAEERLKTKKSPSPSGEQESSNGSNSPHRRQGLSGVFPGEGEKQQRRSPLSSPVDSGPSDEGFTDSSGSATNSSDASDGANRQNQNGEGMTRES
ncbi:hypothetical protein FQN54_004181 [Arachnomyces sp. PD_36]|nr:hypothetical protein FQN54_004181 [Arachnomyces sp. PD_36]